MKIELHSAEEVAGTLGVQVDTLYRYARKGTIHGMKVGKAWRFMDVDVQEFLQKQRYCSRPAVTAVAGDSNHQNGSASHNLEASYADVDAASTLLAESLLRHGVTPDGRVLVLLSNSLEFVVACFGVWKARSILIPDNPSIKDETLLRLLQECAPQALILDRSVADRLAGIHRGMEQVKAVYVKSRASSVTTLASLQVESLEAVLENRSGSKSLRFNGPIPESAATLAFANGPHGLSKSAVSTHRP